MMEEGKGSAGSDFAKRVQEWRSENPDEAARLDREEEFFKSARAFLVKTGCSFRSSCGSLPDKIGGELFYIYVPPPTEKPIRLGRGFSKKDTADVGKVLPEALSEYFGGISDAIKESLEQLLSETVSSSLSQWRPIGKGLFRPLRSLRFLNEVNIEYDSGSGAVITRFPKQRGGYKTRKLTADEIAGLPARYDDLHSRCKDIKDHHDRELERYKATEAVRRHGFSPSKWLEAWLDTAKHFYPDHPKEFLALFADQDNYTSSASEIAYQQLAGEISQGPAYTEKLVGRGRKMVKAREESGRTFKSDD